MRTLAEPAAALEQVEVPVPSPGPGQVLVKVSASALNFPDVLLCRGEYQVRPELPFTPGSEASGTIVAVGAGVDAARIGERVLGTTALPYGGFAEYAVIAPALPAPASLDDGEAAALQIGYQTGWFALHRRARLQAGETLLVHAAAGGVGSAAIQLGKAAGARVIGVVGGPEKAEIARRLGADIVVDRHGEDFVAVVKDATDGRGADVVFDPVGGSTYQRSTKCIAFEGRIVVIGFAGGEIQQAALNHALVKNYAILGLHWGLYNLVAPDTITQCHTELTRLADAGVVRPLVTERLGFDDVADGLQRLGDGTTAGRLVFDSGFRSGPTSGEGRA